MLDISLFIQVSCLISLDTWHESFLLFRLIENEFILTKLLFLTSGEKEGGSGNMEKNSEIGKAHFYVFDSFYKTDYQSCTMRL